jgi:SAM-dependent methyltransferase
MFDTLKKIIPVAVKDTIKKQRLLFLHRGDTYTCPLCGYKAKDLREIGMDFQVIKEKQIIGAGRRFGACYNCRSFERERHVFLYLKEKVKLFSEKKYFKILHIAPEKKLSNILYHAGLGEYVCGDLMTEGYERIYAKFVRKMDVLNIPYKGDYFDLVICNHVLEHIPNDADAMKEIYRVLKPAGSAILQVPISKILEKTFEDFSVALQDRGKIFGQPDHVRIYGQDYPYRLASAGFVVEQINLSHEFPNMGLIEEEDIFIARK